MAKKFKIIGKSYQMRSILIKEGDKLVQRPIRLGITREVTEDQITPHIRRQAAKKVIKIVEVEEPKKKRFGYLKQD